MRIRPVRDDRRSWTLTPLVVILGLLGLLSCDARAPTPPDRHAPPAPGGSRLVLANWEDYIDRGLLDEFTRTTGILVELVEFGTQDECLAMIGDPTRHIDVAVVSRYLVPTLRGGRIISAFDPALLPHVGALVPELQTPVPGLVPYQWGTTGLIVDTRRVTANADSLEMLWDPANRGRIALLDEVRELSALVLKRAGRSISATDPEALDEADRLGESLAANRPRFGDTLENIDALLRGDVWIAHSYSGDYQYKAKGRPGLRWVLPREGFTVWQDYFALVAASPNSRDAHRLVDWLSRPAHAARNAQRYFNPPPFAAAMALLPLAFREDPDLLPPPAVFARGEIETDSGLANPRLQRLFHRVKRIAP